MFSDEEIQEDGHIDIPEDDIDEVLPPVADDLGLGDDAYHEDADAEDDLHFGEGFEETE